jgi:hypothetical protein
MDSIALKSAILGVTEASTVISINPSAALDRMFFLRTKRKLVN